MVYRDPYPAASDPYGGYDFPGESRGRLESYRMRAANEAASARKASDILNELAPVPEHISPEEEQGLVSAAGEATLGGLASLGNILDIPGSMIRDTLALENPFDQVLPWNWTTHEGRTTGRELLTKYGLTNPNDPSTWEGADFAGFGAEIALDPLSWFSLGLLGTAKSALTSGGKIVSKMGKLGTLPDVAAQLPRNLAKGRYIGPREARRMTLKDFLNDPTTAYTMFPPSQTGGAGRTASKAALLNRAQEVAGASNRGVRKAAREAGDVAAREAGDQAVTKAVRSGADDAGQVSAREAAEEAAWDTGGAADVANRRVLRDHGKGVVAAELDRPLGGDLQFGVPFGPTIGKPFNIAGNRFARGMDEAGRYVSQSRFGQHTAKLFDSAVGGRFGKYAQAAMRASRHYQDANAQSVFQHIQGLSHGMDESSDVFREFFGDQIKSYQVGAMRPLPHEGLSVGDIVRTKDMGANGRIMGVDDAGEYIVRVENPENGAWKMITRSIDDPLSARVASAGSEEAARFSDALVEDALNSFMGASSELGFEKALDSWFVGDVFDRLGYSGKRGRVRLIDRVRPHGTAHGIRALSPEQYSRLEGTVNNFVGKAHRAADSLRDDLVARGVPIGDIYDDANQFFYFPRRATPETLERVKGPRNIETNLLGDTVTPPAGNSVYSETARRARDFSTLTDTALGRTEVTAHVPRHVLERMYQDQRILNVRNVDESLGYVDDLSRSADIDEVAEIIRADPEYRKYLVGPKFLKGSWSPYNKQKYLEDITPIKKGGNGLGKKAAIDNAMSRHAQEMAETVVSHRGHGKVYMPDMVTVFAQHANQMASKRALLDGAFTTLASAARRTGKPGKEATVFKALRALGLDVKVTQKTIKKHGQKADEVRNVFSGESLRHLARTMGIQASDDNLRRLAQMDVPVDLVKQFGGTHIASNPHNLRPLLKAIDEATAMFKSNVTLPFAAFGMRNLMSGQFVNLASGEMKNTKDVADYIRAVFDTGKMRANPSGRKWKRWMEEIRAEGFVEGRHHFQDVPKIGGRRSAFAKRGLEEATPGGMFRGADERFLSRGSAARTVIDPREWAPALRQRYSEAAEHVATEPHVVKKFIGETQPVGEAGATLHGPRAAWRTGLSAGSDFNRHVEFTNRVPMYLYLRRKGFGASEAAGRVRDLQFDYGRLAPFEKNVMRRAVPFYAFTRKMGPLFMSTLAERPGGLMGMSIRGSRLASADRGAILPEYIGGQTTLPLEWLGMKPKEEGAVSFVTGLGLAHEDPISYLAGLGPLGRGDFTKAGRRTFSEIMRRTNPLLKGPAEYLTGHSFFQTGPGGTGRALEEMDPTLGRLKSNIRQAMTGRVQHGKPDPLFGSPLLESAVSSSPISRYATTLRQLSDPRKGIEEKALNFLTGIRTTTLSPYQQDYAMKQAFEGIAKEGRYGGEYKQAYIDRYRLLEQLRDGKISEEEFRRGLLMQGYYRALQKKRRGSREEDKLRRLAAIE